MTQADQNKPEAVDDAFGIKDLFVDQVRDAVDTGAAPALNAMLDDVHPADIAHLIEMLDARRRAELLTLWKGGLDGEVLSELDENLREEVIDSLAPAELVEAVRELDSDDVVDLVEDLGVEQQEAVLDALDAPDRVVVEKALAYPEESAGRHMQVELVRAPTHWSVGEAIDYLRSDDLKR